MPAPSCAPRTLALPARSASRPKTRPTDLADWAAERDRTIRRFLAFLVCAAGIAAGVWYARNGGWWSTEQDAAGDEPDDSTPEGFGYRLGGKKTGPRPKKKTGEARQARGEAVAHGEPPGPGGPTGPSYESAIADNNLILAPGTKQVPDLTDAELAGPMRTGTFLDQITPVCAPIYVYYK